MVLRMTMKLFRHLSLCLAYRFGSQCCCPRCGTNFLTRLDNRDPIDRMDRSVWNALARFGGGKLYHCGFCRMQFYDRRRGPIWNTSTSRTANGAENTVSLAAGCELRVH